MVIDTSVSVANAIRAIPGTALGRLATVVLFDEAQARLAIAAFARLGKRMDTGRN